GIVRDKRSIESGSEIGIRNGIEPRQALVPRPFDHGRIDGGLGRHSQYPFGINILRRLYKASLRRMVRKWEMKGKTSPHTNVIQITSDFLWARIDALFTIDENHQ